MVQVTDSVKPPTPDGSARGESARGDSGGSTSKPDARSERWREHRLSVRQSFVDAALEAIDIHGPDVSMDDIAKTAGAAKPKLYRHFADKADLYGAIVENVEDMLWDRILMQINLFADSVAVLIDRGMGEYAKIVSEHPNLFRFLVHSHFTQHASEGASADTALDSARAAARGLATLFADATSAQGMDSAAIELVSYSSFGAVASATDWWLGAADGQERPMPIETFSAYVASIVRGLIESSCALAGVTIESDLPMHCAFTRSGEQS